MRNELDLRDERMRAGLCADCSHARIVDSERGARFYMCELSKTDPTFVKYPRLPVLQCDGFERGTAK